MIILYSVCVFFGVFSFIHLVQRSYKYLRDLLFMESKGNLNLMCGLDHLFAWSEFDKIVFMFSYLLFGFFGANISAFFAINESQRVTLCGRRFFNDFLRANFSVHYNFHFKYQILIFAYFFVKLIAVDNRSLNSMLCQI